MNDRIEKLAKEHRLIHIHMSTGEYNDTMKKFEKLAELVVKECISVCECEWDGDADTFATSEAYNECADAIKEHFGVER
jgi:hypothetical protein